MIELMDFMMQHFLQGVTRNMVFGHIQTPKLIILDIFHRRFVLAPADKAANNVVVV